MNSLDQTIPFVCKYLKIKDLINLRCVSRLYFKLVNKFFDGNYKCRFSNFDLVLNERRLDVELKSEKDRQFNFWTNKWYDSNAAGLKNKTTDLNDLMDFDFTISLNNAEKLHCFRPLMINYLGCCVKRLKLIFKPEESNSTFLFDHLAKYERLEQLDVHMFPFSSLFNLLEHPNLRVLYINDENIGKDSGLEVNCPKLETLHLNLTRPEFKLVHTSQLKHLSSLHFGYDSALDLSGYKSLETLECNRIKNFELNQLTKLPNLREFIVKFSTLFNTQKLIQLFDKTELRRIVNKLDIYLTDKKVSKKEDCQRIFNQYRHEINMPSITKFDSF